MQYRTLGRTGLEVSALTLGGGFVGGLLVEADDETKRAAIRLCIEGGINWIDTAHDYGGGRSEESLGWLLDEIDTPFHISTKVRLMPSDLDDIPGQIERSVEESLRRLRLDSVDLIQLHDQIAAETGGKAIAVEQVLKKGGAADGLERVRDAGLARYIGLTALGDALAIRQALDSGRFDTAQVYYNLLNPSAGRAMPPVWSGHDYAGVLDACRAHDVGVFNIRVLAAGVLATDVRHGRESPVTGAGPLAEEERRAAAVHAALGDRYGTRAQTAIRFALASPDIHTVVFGVAQTAHIEEALGAIELGPLPKEALEIVAALYESDFGRV